MRTRTLLLLAIGCGLAILLAGGIQLLRIAGQDEPAAALHVGDGGKAGDAVVTVKSVREDATAVTVTVTLSGVDDPAGIDGFRLKAPASDLVPPSSDSTCKGITVAAATCDLVFPAAGLEGTDRQLVFRRAEEQLRWILV